MNAVPSDDESPQFTEPALSAIEAAVARVVRRHRETLARMRTSLGETRPAETDARENVGGEPRDYLRDELASARQMLARAQATIRAQAREIERLAAELETRS